MVVEGWWKGGETGISRGAKGRRSAGDGHRLRKKYGAIWQRISGVLLVNPSLWMSQMWSRNLDPVGRVEGGSKGGREENGV